MKCFSPFALQSHSICCIESIQCVGVCECVRPSSILYISLLVCILISTDHYVCTHTHTHTHRQQTHATHPPTHIRARAYMRRRKNGMETVPNNRLLNEEAHTWCIHKCLIDGIVAEQYSMGISVDVTCICVGLSLYLPCMRARISCCITEEEQQQKSYRRRLYL